MSVKRKISVALPWPPAELSPNFRGHWALSYRQKRLYRTIARLRTNTALREAQARPHGPVASVDMLVSVFPKAVRRRDQDNFIARLKSAYDGIADALHIDDSAFVQRGLRFCEKRNPPCVVIDVEWEEEEEQEEKSQ